ncbi:MAG: condensation domain-containing protein [bacterium]
MSVLTGQQERLWELENQLGASAMHAFALAYHLEGPLDVQQLAESIGAVAERHPALHSRVAVADGRPIFAKVMPPSLVIRSFTCSKSDGGDAKLDTALGIEAAKPLDVRTSAGWRAVLFERSAESHTLFVQFHHIFVDRLSVGVFMTDLATAFRNIQANLPPFDTELALAESPSRDIPSAQVAYWETRFAQPAATLDLPSAHRLETFSDYAGARIESVIASGTVAALQQLAGVVPTTMFPMLLAAFAATLHAHTGQEDLVVCTPMVGRHRGAIGYFNNIVPLRLDLSGDPTFLELVARITAEASDASAHQDVPFHAIASLPELASTRITRCLFVIQQMTGLRLALPGVSVRLCEVPNGTANFDLALFLEEIDGRVDVLLDHKTSVLDTIAATSLRDHFLEILDRVASEPAQRLSDLPSYERVENDVAVPRGTSGGYRPRNLLEQRMVEIWRVVFPGAEINGNSHFFALGGDSMRAARLFTLIEKEFGHQLPLASLIHAPTPIHLTAKMHDAEWVAPWLSLMPIKVTGTRPPIFCVHSAGDDGLLTFKLIGDCLPEDQPLYSLQGSGLKHDERPTTTVEEMAKRYVESVRQLFPRGPYLLAGHSLGAAVAYEMAQQLIAGGGTVAFLGLFDHPGPRLKPGWRDRITNRVSSSFRRIATSGVEQPHLRALLDYDFRPYPGRVMLFRAMEGSPRIHSDPLGGWGDVAGGGVDVIEVPGTHDSMLEPPHVVALGEAISHYIARLHITE